MKSHGQHSSELQEGFPGCGVEAAGHDFDHGVLDPLKHVDEALGAVWSVPKLATIGEYREADRVHDQAPIRHGEAANGVSKDLQGLDGGACPIAHDPDMGFPFEAVMEEEAEVAHGGGCSDFVRSVGGGEGDGVRGGNWVA